MASINTKPEPPKPLNPDCLPLFFEGISLTLARWTALQMAVRDEWGGRNSRSKYDQLAADIFNWFTKSKEPLYIDDLEDMLDQNMIAYFSAELEDGSLEEDLLSWSRSLQPRLVLLVENLIDRNGELCVSEKLMVMHEEFLNGNYDSVEKLRASNSAVASVALSREVVNEDDEISDTEGSDMAVDEPEPEPVVNTRSSTTSVNDVHKQRETGTGEDGWTVVGSKRNKGRNH